ncbi:sucrase ferredoxin [Salsipaludibacter albus]|uniref:sucrase ferredoxin n=1 Tax=Salsipaludibacter albus TaxID=2849650 RepID=UPI001EE44585|nr:sucrase ferredoxin [Salsipaludibacter albus]
MSDVLDPDQRCALVARDDEPLAGTAPEAPWWVLVEDPGPWGRDALADGGLPERVVAHLVRQTEAHGVRYQAVRRPDRTRKARRAVYLANVRAGWLARLDLPVEQLVDLDLAVVTADRAPAGATEVTDPLVAVCTHSRRDACCALWGRPMVASLARRAPDVVWETSHTSGHRFAPSILAFPTGGVYGFVDDPEALLDDLLDGRLHLAHYRGDPALSRPAQAAEVTVRRAHDLTDPAAVRVVSSRHDGATATVVVTSPAGREVVVLDRVELPPAMTSCGGDPKPRATWRVRSVGGDTPG